jgi:hypothetical protein
VAVAGLDVFVVASHRPAGTPDGVVVDGDPARLLAKMRDATAAAECG